ncbi:hypothetical protein BBK36DRAFT_1165087 [Trichoderma citrinoviride]|uniref:Uncharacterized protein n=1 Tax=Trichoderma citrinoviride TaxID=58853 RepID=A0A2T4BMN0_9HYPO|nr:hypothetical protein BBK36DRAFT_1165087 [Trichoderma citrinoviride]PTB70563.1 hypothetical protein BBK36DRAFT_1165087 [Trichoderma citrinoviride]
MTVASHAPLPMLHLITKRLTQSPCSQEAKKFVKPDGRLLTNRENRDFFATYNLEPDNGAARRLTTGPALQNASKAYNATIAFSPRHLIHPHDLRFFDPRGHPLAAARRDKYRRKTLEEPLWIMLTGAGASSVVRTLTQRRLKCAIYRSLEDLGFRNGVGNGKEIRGTLWITIHDPVKASKLSPWPFGEAVAKALASRCAQPLR